MKTVVGTVFREIDFMVEGARFIIQIPKDMLCRGASFKVDMAEYQKIEEARNGPIGEGGEWQAIRLLVKNAELEIANGKLIKAIEHLEMDSVSPARLRNVTADLEMERERMEKFLSRLAKALGRKEGERLYVDTAVNAILEMRKDGARKRAELRSLKSNAASLTEQVANTILQSGYLSDRVRAKKLEAYVNRLRSALKIAQSDRDALVKKLSGSERMASDVKFFLNALSSRFLFELGTPGSLGEALQEIDIANDYRKRLERRFDKLKREALLHLGIVWDSDVPPADMVVTGRAKDIGERYIKLFNQRGEGESAYSEMKRRLAEILSESLNQEIDSSSGARILASVEQLANLKSRMRDALELVNKSTDEMKAQLEDVLDGFTPGTFRLQTLIGMIVKRYSDSMDEISTISASEKSLHERLEKSKEFTDKVLRMVDAETGKDALNAIQFLVDKWAEHQESEAVKRELDKAGGIDLESIIGVGVAGQVVFGSAWSIQKWLRSNFHDSWTEAASLSPASIFIPDLSKGLPEDAVVLDHEASDSVTVSVGNMPSYVNAEGLYFDVDGSPMYTNNGS